MCNCSSVLPGFVGKKGQLQFNYDPKKGKTITVVVSGCLNGGTSWEWTLRDAPECGKNNSSVYVPFAGKKVSKISISSTKGSSSEIIYTYDNSGTIATMKKGAYTYTYTFAGNNLTVKKGSEILYQCTLNNSGYISSVSNKGTTCTYNSNMYMTRCDYGSYYFTVKYDSKNNQSEVSTVVSGTSTQYYTYSNYENKTNIDLNAIVTNAFPYEAWFGEYGILSPFSLFGKRSPYLSNKDVYNNQHTFNISYTNTDGYPTKIVVTDNATVNNNGTTTYMITY